MCDVFPSCVCVCLCVCHNIVHLSYLFYSQRHYAPPPLLLLLLVLSTYIETFGLMGKARRSNNELFESQQIN